MGLFRSPLIGVDREWLRLVPEGRPQGRHAVQQRPYFIERAHANRILAQRVEFPSALPRKVTTSWEAIQDTLYMLTVLFGVLSLPKVTLYGVWKGKEGMDWHDETLKLNCRSPKIEPLIERGIAIVEAHERL